MATAVPVAAAVAVAVAGPALAEPRVAVTVLGPAAAHRARGAAWADVGVAAAGGADRRGRRCGRAAGGRGRGPRAGIDAGEGRPGRLGPVAGRRRLDGQRSALARRRSRRAPAAAGLAGATGVTAVGRRGAGSRGGRRRRRSTPAGGGRPRPGASQRRRGRLGSAVVRSRTLAGSAAHRRRPRRDAPWRSQAGAASLRATCASSADGGDGDDHERGERRLVVEEDAVLGAESSRDSLSVARGPHQTPGHKWPEMD